MCGGERWWVDVCERQTDRVLLPMYNKGLLTLLSTLWMQGAVLCYGKIFSTHLCSGQDSLVNPRSSQSIAKVFAEALVQSLGLWDTSAFIFSCIVSTPFLLPPNHSTSSVLFNLCSSDPDNLQCVIVVSCGFSLLSEMCFLTTVGVAWRDKRDFPRIWDILLQICEKHK